MSSLGPGSSSQQESGQRAPLVVNRRKQHCPLGLEHLTGPPHSVIDITAMPAAPATPTSPSPPRTGARTAVLPKLAAVRRAKPPGEKVTIEIVLKRFKIFPENQILSLDLT